MVEQAVLKIDGKISDQFCATINQAINMAQEHKIWPDWCKID